MRKNVLLIISLSLVLLLVSKPVYSQMMKNRVCLQVVRHFAWYILANTAWKPFFPVAEL